MLGQLSERGWGEEACFGHHSGHFLICIQDGRHPWAVARPCKDQVDHHSLFLPPLVRVDPNNAVALDSVDLDLFFQNHGPGSVLDERYQAAVAKAFAGAENSLGQAQDDFTLAKVGPDGRS